MTAKNAAKTNSHIPAAPPAHEATPEAPLPTPESVAAANLLKTAAPVRLAPKLRPRGLVDPGQKRRSHMVFLDENVTIEDTLNPNFWCHNTNEMTPLDLVDILTHDGVEYAQVMVREVDKKGLTAKVALLNRVNLLDARKKAIETATPDSDDAYKTEYKGAKKWSVIRVADGAYLAEGLATKDAATSWLADHKAKLTAA